MTAIHYIASDDVTDHVVTNNKNSNGTADMPYGKPKVKPNNESSTADYDGMNDHQRARHTAADGDDQRSTVALKAALSIPGNALGIRVGETLNKSTLLQALGAALDFPAYYAYNWDSAWDCLTDSDASHLWLDLTHVKHIQSDDLTTFIAMIEDAYHDYGQPQLWLVTP